MIFPSSQKSSAACRRSKITLRSSIIGERTSTRNVHPTPRLPSPATATRWRKIVGFSWIITRLCDVAIKVVGVGSVGTWCGIVLLLASETDPLFLQVKEAGPSVLEAYAGKSIYPNHGQRVVNGAG